MQALLQTKNRALAEAQQRAEQVPKPNALLEPDIILPPIDPALAAAGLVALLLLVLLWRRQRNKQARGEDRVAPAIEPTLAQTVIGAAGGRQIDTAHSVFHSNFVPSVSQIDTNEVDAVAEADVYIAYGRSEQAEEILLDALRAHPERHALRVKLLEIYAARNDRQRFGTLAAELRVLTHGQGADWARAAQLGQSLEPENYLYDAPVRGAVTESVAEVEFPTATNTLTTNHLPPITQGPLSPAVLNTKFELALACREIGDHAGARELLAEVAHARDPELAQRAQTLLQQLA
jgi:FimV-like protein